MITRQNIAAIGGVKARADICAAVADFINTHGGGFFLDTPARLHHFLGQCDVESGGYSTLEENLNYSVEGLKKTFGRHRISTADCERYGSIKGKRSANKSAIANLIYGGAFVRDMKCIAGNITIPVENPTGAGIGLNGFWVTEGRKGS